MFPPCPPRPTAKRKRSLRPDGRKPRFRPFLCPEPNFCCFVKNLKAGLRPFDFSSITPYGPQNEALQDPLPCGSFWPFSRPLQALLGAVLKQELSTIYKPTALSSAQPHGVKIAMDVFTALTTTRSQRLNMIPQE